MSRTLHFGLLFALVCAAVGSCISPPSFPDTPRIKFKKWEVVRIPGPAGSAPLNSDTITVSFEDGNGDLGLSTPPEDTQPPYQEYLDVANRIRNPDYYNYFIQPQIKDRASGEFVDYVYPPRFEGLNARYPRLGPNTDKEAPLKGDLRINVKLTLGSPFNPGDEIRFRIKIKDRALNESNEVLTNSYVVQPR